jgi:hypothetical protein
MKMRFTDIDKWRDPWFRNLSPTQKLVYLYLLDNCDHAGFIEIDAPIVLLYLRLESTYQEEELYTLLDLLSPKVIEFKQHIYYIKNFIRFQYKGELKENYNPHKAVFKRLAHYGVYLDENYEIKKDNSRLAQGLPKPPRLGLGLGLGLGNNNRKETRDELHSKGF